MKTAAPDQIVVKATITMMQDGKPKSLQIATNGFTCFISGYGRPLCADENAPTQPYVMFPGTKYEHLMLPVTAGK